MVWSQSDRVVQMLQPMGLTEQVVVVEVELYSPVVQWVQMVVVVVVVVVVEVELYSPVVQCPDGGDCGGGGGGGTIVMQGAPRNRKWLGLMPINPLS